MQGGIVLKKQSNLSRLLSYAGGHKYFTYASWVLSGISALTALVPFWYIWKIINEVLEVSPNFGSAANLTHYGIMAMTYAIISYLIYIGALLCSHLAAFRIAANMRIDITEHISKLPIGFTDSFGSGKLRKIINDSTAATETYLAHQLPDKYAAMATPVGLLALLLVFDWRLGLLSLVPVAVGFAVMSAMTGKRMEEKMRQYGNALAAMSNEAVEYVRGIPVVKTFGQSVFSFKKFKATIDEYKKWVLAYTKDMRLPMMLYTAAINGVFALLILGAFWFTNGTVTSEFFVNLLFYIIITPVISVTLTKIMYMSEEGMVISDAIERIDSVLNAEPMSIGNYPQKPKSASIELENIHFSYDGKKEVISDISLKIKDGQTVAFVGPSGGGKSTLASLISRFFDVNSGSIKIGGVDVRDIPKDELMNTVSFVFQNSKLIKASILDNVKMGKSNATDEEVLNALRAAQCMDIIEKFPDGVNTVIGSRGVYLSGGEMQRIAIARAVLKNAPIIILDEATAFADPDNEVKVQKAFAKLSEGKTVIMIAHRLSTVRNVDCIYVISDGKIVEYGNRAELIEKKGMFYKMQNDYQSSVGWKVSNETEESRND
jgi:ATP-binding cassette subfamily B protein IrtA